MGFTPDIKQIGSHYKLRVRKADGYLEEIMVTREEIEELEVISSKLIKPVNASKYLRNIYYFAYGSNMLEEQMKDRCGEDNYKNFGCGYIEDFELAFTRRSQNWCSMGVADLKDKIGVKTYGQIYRINVIARNKLDCSEGFKYKKLEDLEKNSYIRKDDVSIYSDKLKKNVLASCYFANPQANFIQPSKKYLDTIIKGAEECSLPPSAIDTIRRIGRYDIL